MYRVRAILWRHETRTEAIRTSSEVVEGCRGRAICSTYPLSVIVNASTALPFVVVLTFLSLTQRRIAFALSRIHSGKVHKCAVKNCQTLATGYNDDDLPLTVFSCASNNKHVSRCLAKKRLCGLPLDGNPRLAKRVWQTSSQYDEVAKLVPVRWRPADWISLWLTCYGESPSVILRGHF